MKSVIVGISSSIALYKVLEIIKAIQTRDSAIEVSVIMTENATKLIDPKEFQVLVGDRIYTQTFNRDFNYRNYIEKDEKIEHISLSDSADLMIVVPATANSIGKFANGICDDLLSTTFVSFNGPKLIAPAMNCKMWENDIVQKNVSILKSSGVEIIDPEYGELACGYSGVGRLADIKKITGVIVDELKKTDDFKGKTVLITAGPTREDIDPARYISNRSSGKMGFALAKAARNRGADVVLITGPVGLVDPVGIKVVKVRSAKEMQEKVVSHFDDCDVFVSAAAVADYRVEKSEEKIKKKEFIDLKLEKNPDILYEMGKANKGDKVLVGFALETSNVLENARDKLNRKKLDLIVANDQSAFNSDNNSVFIIDKNDVQEVKKTSKITISHMILDAVKSLESCDK